VDEFDNPKAGKQKIPQFELENDEIRYWAAFNFPSVLLTLGPEKWDALRDYYLDLTFDKENIRRTLACSFHEVQKILGIDKTETEMYPIFQ
jgi:hypothetical protein